MKLASEFLPTRTLPCRIRALDKVLRAFKFAQRWRAKARGRLAGRLGLELPAEDGSGGAAGPAGADAAAMAAAGPGVARESGGAAEAQPELVPSSGWGSASPDSRVSDSSSSDSDEALSVA